MTDAPMVEDWAGERGEAWSADLDHFEGMIAPPGEALMERAAFRAGERVVDVGCGGGATTLAIARAVGSTGEAVGFDISAELVARAGERAATAGLANLRFVQGDAAGELPPRAPFDRLFSRFGSMFFPDAVAGFTNLHRMVRRGGAIDLAVWGPARDNGWMSEVTAVVRGHVALPPPVARAPGPFAFDEPAYLGEVLAAAGFHDADFVDWRGEQPVGGPGTMPEKAAAFMMRAMAFAPMLAQGGAATMAAVEAELVGLFARNHQPGRGVMMPGRAWLVRTYA